MSVVVQEKRRKVNCLPPRSVTRTANASTHQLSLAQQALSAPTIHLYGELFLGIWYIQATQPVAQMPRRGTLLERGKNGR